jgi:hypothetical protein
MSSTQEAEPFHYLCFMRILLSWLTTLIVFASYAQDIKVEYDKERDLTGYTTFTMGEGEITTPKDQRVVADDELKKYVHDAIVNELKGKGLTQIDSLGDLTASYIVGSLALMDIQNLGPMGTSPNSSERTWSRDYRQGNLVVDLNDKRNVLIWRVSASTSYGTPSTDKLIQNIIAKGFKKFSIQPGKKKKKG